MTGAFSRKLAVAVLLPVALAVLVLLLPVGATGAPMMWWQAPAAAGFVLVGAAIVALSGFLPGTRAKAIAAMVGATVLAAAPLLLLDAGVAFGFGGAWLVVIAVVLLGWKAMSGFSTTSGGSTLERRVLVPALFGLLLVFLWEVGVRGFDVPAVLLPPPSDIAAAFASNLDVLWADFWQTVVRAVLRGYAIGCAAGFGLAILVHRIPFLARGLLPLSNLVSAVPIVGIAPIMVMWFGFDWESKAAVVVVMTFFPMLVNTLAGLENIDRMDLDLMRSYGAGYWQTLLKVRLPAALPFIFNGLKINSTLALIGAIVAEFFGTPIVGMGFRISTEVARMNVDVVWATIAVAALVGSGAYGILAFAERKATFWHPSFRG